MKKYAKENYIINISRKISNYGNGDSHSAKTFWQLMGRFMGPPLRSDNNEYAYTDEEKSEVLNNLISFVQCQQSMKQMLIY